MVALQRTAPARRRGPFDGVAAQPGHPGSLAVPALVVGAWTLLLVLEVTGAAAALHHHALIEGGPPLAFAIPLFLAGWLVMVAAMMLPASLPTISVVAAATSWQNSPRLARVAFVAAFALVWMAFGLVAFLGDVVLHQAVDTTPWLAARPWLIEAAILSVAGGYQFLRLKRRSLAACRHPAAPTLTTARATLGGASLGLHHGLLCLASSWALMLLMFAEGFASLGWLATLTAVMAYETSGRHGTGASSVVGIALILAAVATLAGVPGGGL